MENDKTHIIAMKYLFILLSYFFLISCECDDEKVFLQVVLNPFQVKEITYPFEFENYTGALITFNKQYDPQSVNLDNSLVISGSDINQSLLEELILQVSDSSLFIPFREIHSDPCDKEPNVYISCSTDSCELEIKLLSSISDSSGILSSEGQLLDGDRDGFDGGDFEESIVFQDADNTFSVTSVEYPVEVPGCIWGVVFSFNQPIQMSSVALGSSLIISGNGVNISNLNPSHVQQVSCNSFFVAVRDKLTGTCDDVGISYIACQATSCTAEIRLASSITSDFGIRTSNGRLLDGDDNGQEGGDFIYTFDLP